MPTRKKTAPKKTAARKAPKPSPKARKPSNTLSDRINVIGRTVIDIEQAVKDIQSQLASLSQPTVEHAAPQPIGLSPGDYTDASKETADALTAMGWGWLNAYQGYDYIRLSTCTVGELTNSSARYYKPNHLTPAEFLSRAAVTAKELGLVPVERWVPEVGQWVVVTSAHHHPAVPICSVVKVKAEDWVDGLTWDVIGPDGNAWPYLPEQLRPATDAEVQQHLAEQEARANAEKMAKLKAMKPGTPIKVKGKKQCTFIALERECLVWYAHYEDESYYAALAGASDITVIEQP